MRGTAHYDEHYSTDQMEHFIEHVCRSSEQSLSTGAKTFFRDIFLKMYANPLINQLEQGVKQDIVI